MKDFILPLKEDIHQTAKKYIKEGTVAPIDFQGYTIFLKTGQRLPFENQYFERRKELAVLALEQKLNPNQKTLNMLEKVIWEVCSEYSWALPAHLSIKDGTYVEEAGPCVDLFAAETVETFSEIIFHLKKQLDPFLLTRMNREIHHRVFHPFLEKHWFWENGENNWSAVVCGAVGLASLYLLEKNSPLQQKILNKVDVVLKRYLEGFQDDGVCREGIGYWVYGFGYYIYFAEFFQRVFDDDKYLSGKKVKEIAAFPERVEIGLNQFVPFSDYASEKLPTGLLSFLKKELKVEIPHVSSVSPLDFDHCYRFAHLSRNLAWTKESMKEEIPIKKDHYFPDAQWLIYKDDNFVFAAKGGNNNESHNHNDVGNFILGDISNLLLTDLGASEYTREYFEEETRYSFLNTSSIGHSVPIINQELQQAGPVSAKEVSYVDDEFKMDLEEVYSPEAEIEKFTREFKLGDFPKRIQILDSFKFKTSNNTVLENFVSIIKPTIIKNGAVIEDADSRLTITNDKGTIAIIEKEFSAHNGSKKKAYLIQFETEILWGESVITTNFDLENKS